MSGSFRANGIRLGGRKASQRKDEHEAGDVHGVVAGEKDVGAEVELGKVSQVAGWWESS
jgi:hypothetical protein